MTDHRREGIVDQHKVGTGRNKSHIAHRQVAFADVANGDGFFDLRTGADIALNYQTEDFVEVVKRETNGRGADVIYDPVGGEIGERSTKCIAFEGRLVLIGFTSSRVSSSGSGTSGSGSFDPGGRGGFGSSSSSPGLCPL